MGAANFMYYPDGGADLKKSLFGGGGGGGGGQSYGVNLVSGENCMNLK